MKPLVSISEKFGLSRAEAAAYVGVSIDKFDEMVKDGRMPKPKTIDARRVWARSTVEKFFAELPEEGQTPKKPSPWKDLRV